jgi:hypothetical protein
VVRGCQEDKQNLDSGCPPRASEAEALDQVAAMTAVIKENVSDRTTLANISERIGRPVRAGD